MLDERVLGIDAFVVLVDPLQRPIAPRRPAGDDAHPAPALQRDVPLEYDARRDPFPDQLEQPAGLGDREPVLGSPLAPGPDLGDPQDGGVPVPVRRLDLLPGDAGVGRPRPAPRDVEGVTGARDDAPASASAQASSFSPAATSIGGRVRRILTGR